MHLWREYKYDSVKVEVVRLRKQYLDEWADVYVNSARVLIDHGKLDKARKSLELFENFIYHGYDSPIYDEFLYLKQKISASAFEM